MLFYKEVIRPGTYYYTDEATKQPRKLVVSSAGVKHLYEQGQKMLGAGLSIPIPLEHQPTAKPQNAQEKAASQVLHNSGWVQKYFMRGDRLFALTDIADPNIAARIPKSIRWTSPWITSFTDGDGKKWDGVIGHLALTSRPRITRQEPFESAAAALSMAGTVLALTDDGKGVAPDGLFVSRAGLLAPDEHGNLAPVFPMAFSVWSGVSLAADVPPEKPAEPPGKAAPDKPPDSKLPTPPAKPGEPAVPQVHEEEMELCDVLRDVISALWGIELPEDTDAHNLEQRLMKGLMEHLKSSGVGAQMSAPPGNQPPTPPRNDLPPNPPTGQHRSPVQEMPPMYMSLEQIEAISDPALKATAKLAHTLLENQLGNARAHRQARVERLAARLPPATRDKLLAMAAGPGATLSIDDKGAVQDGLSTFLDVMEGSVIDLPSLLKSPSASFAAQSHPQEYAGGMTPEREKQVVEEFAANTGLDFPAQPQKQAG
jgi:hypothetical protein